MIIALEGIDGSGKSTAALDLSFQLVGHKAAANRTYGWLLKEFGHLAITHITEVHDLFLAGTTEFTFLDRGHRIPILMAGFGDAELDLFTHKNGINR